MITEQSQSNCDIKTFQKLTSTRNRSSTWCHPLKTSSIAALNDRWSSSDVPAANCFFAHLFSPKPASVSNKCFRWALRLPCLVRKDYVHREQISWCDAQSCHSQELRDRYRWESVDELPRSLCGSQEVAVIEVSFVLLLFLLQTPRLTFCISTVVTLRLIVFNSAKRYKSIKYSWQKRHAPFRRPSIVDAWRRR